MHTTLRNDTLRCHSRFDLALVLSISLCPFVFRCSLRLQIAQVVAAELGLSLSAIRVAEVSTDSVPNTSATAGSTGADLNAVRKTDKKKLPCVACVLAPSVSWQMMDRFSVRQIQCS